MVLKKLAALFVILASAFISHAQQTFHLEGRVLDTQGKPIPEANIRIHNSLEGTTSDVEGHFAFTFSAAASDTLIISSVGFQKQSYLVKNLLGRDYLEVKLKEDIQEIGPVEVSGAWHRDRSLIKIEKKDFEMLPTPAGQVESIIKKMPGVSSRNELSSQYSVRGGNYDENLVYVNGIEVYRPVIVRHGKHEGLSFLNSDMVSSIHFSAGGFQAQYGDKMASVLDIRYEKPGAFSGDLEMSLLGGSIHLEDTVGSRFTYNTGFRYQSTSYLLNSLDVEGDYEPSFYDLQTFLTYRLTSEAQLEFLGNYNLNRYRFIPRSRETSFGTIRNALNMNVYYEGQEEDAFENYMGALTLQWNPNSRLNLRWVGSAYNTLESEHYDILGEYFLNELDRS
ncbi:MAG: carboxypeptidase-like regulatory domain-containing protein, partial [Bacteroidales bacterium]|nr:carboxypeptidase-like regulatory domain-containing protein [Bacteroidales bacterium]